MGSCDAVLLSEISDLTLIKPVSHLPAQQQLESSYCEPGILIVPLQQQQSFYSDYFLFSEWLHSTKEITDIDLSQINFYKVISKIDNLPLFFSNKIKVLKRIIIP